VENLGYVIQIFENRGGALLMTCVSGLPPPAAAAMRIWAIVPDRSEVQIYVGKSGLFKMVGHTHEVVAPAVSGRVRLDPDRVEQAEIDLTFDTSALTVSAKDEPPGDLPEVQRTMLSDKVLNVAKYPSIVFRSRQIDVQKRTGGRLQLRVAGQLTLHGITRQIEGPVDVTLSSDRLTGTGTVVVSQTNFGIEPISAGFGAVKVKDEVTVRYTFTAQREP
jgi:polyisoprenoid-binding protein YceI